MDTRTDEELIVRYRDRGDRDALIEVVTRYQERIYNYLLVRLRHSQRAEEATQETFLRMLRSLAGYQADLPFRPWIYRIALNAGRTLVEQSGLRVRKEMEASLASNRRTSSVDPSERALQGEVDVALHELPLEQKEALTLHYAQGLSHSEVASVLGVPSGTAATRIHQGLQSLRSRFRALGMAPEIVEIERMLGSSKAAAAPKSILKVVLTEAARVVPGAAAAQAALVAGGAMAKVKSGVLVTTALLCLSAGGIIGFQVRRARVTPDGSAEAALARSKVQELERTVEDLRGRLQKPGTEIGGNTSGKGEAKSASSPTGSPKVVSRVRKIAAHFAEEERVWALMKDRRHPTPEEEAKLQQVLGKMFSDPELFGSISRAEPWSVDEKTEFTLDLLEELGLPPATPAQAAVIRKAMVDWARVAEAPIENFSSIVEKRSLEIRENTALYQGLRSVLSADQQPLVSSLEQSGFVGLSEARPQGFVLAPPAAGQAASYILNSWSKQIVELDDAERVRLAGAASGHAERLWTAQAELQAKYGEGYIEFLTNMFKAALTSFDLDALREETEKAKSAPDATRAYKEAHPSWETELREGYLRLLQAEQENRDSLIALIPDKAKAIQKAKPFVYLISPAK